MRLSLDLAKILVYKIKGYMMYLDINLIISLVVVLVVVVTAVIVLGRYNRSSQRRAKRGNRVAQREVLREITRKRDILAAKRLNARTAKLMKELAELTAENEANEDALLDQEDELEEIFADLGLRY